MRERRIFLLRPRGRERHCSARAFLTSRRSPVEPGTAPLAMMRFAQLRQGFKYGALDRSGDGPHPDIGKLHTPAQSPQAAPSPRRSHGDRASSVDGAAMLSRSVPREPALNGGAEWLNSRAAIRTTRGSSGDQPRSSCFSAASSERPPRTRSRRRCALGRSASSGGVQRRICRCEQA